jgi:hypothetical protein
MINMVDATYRSELRELNELNYTRFDAKLEQRVVELETKIDRLAVELRAEMQVGFARMDQQFAQFEATLTKRMFVFWDWPGGDDCRPRVRGGEAAPLNVLTPWPPLRVVERGNDSQAANSRSRSSTFTIAHVSRSFLDALLRLGYL